ncbi:thioesterase, partial [Pseudomonas sp. CrR25]|nr:thioesterase [Pseudomonas sp. CrR25]
MISGSYAEAELRVAPSDSAKALSLAAEDEFPEVFATSRMIALMELAAARCMQPLLQAHELSVGVGVDIRHLGATPIGVRVVAKA